MKRLIALTSLSAVLAGCTTQRIYEKDLNRVSEKTIHALEKRIIKPDTNFNYETNKSPNYAELRNIVNPFSTGFLPAHEFELYLFQKNGVLERRKLDTTGPLNAYGNELADLQSSYSKGENNFTLFFGAPEYKKMVSKRSAENQISNRSGLLGITTEGMEKENFIIEINEIRKINVKNFRKEQEYRVNVTFGENLLISRKVQDIEFPIRTAEDALIGFGVAGPGGAVGMFAADSVERTWSFFEGKKIPVNTYISRTLAPIAYLDDNTWNTYEVIDKARKLNANQVIVSQGQNTTRYVYVSGAKDIATGANGVSFTTTRESAHHLYDVLYRLLKAGALLGPVEAMKETEKIPSVSDAVTGGETGGPGGK